MIHIILLIERYCPWSFINTKIKFDTSLSVEKVVNNGARVG